MSRLILLFLVSLICGPAQTQDTLRIFFQKDQSIVQQKDKSEIRSFINEGTECRVRLIGYTDSDGSEKYNESLSNSRVAAVKELLPIKVDGMESHGERFAADESMPESIKSTDRRVDIIKICSFAEKENHKGKEIEDQKFKSFRGLKKPAQWFLIDPTVENNIVGKEGTEVLIPSYSFVDEEGNIVEDSVSFRLTEYYEKSEFILYNMTSSSNRYPLESGGMIDIGAKIGEKELDIKPGNQLRLDFRGNQRKTGMEVFYSNHRRTDEDSEALTGLNNDFVNWIPNSFGVNTFETYAGVSKKIGKRYKTRMYRKDNGNVVTIRTTYLRNKEPIIDTTVAPWYNKDPNPYLYTGNMGLINCDRFLNSGKELVNQIVVQQPEMKELSGGCFLVLENANGVMPMYQGDEGDIFPNLPRGMKGVIVSIYKKGEWFYMAKKNVKAQAENPQKIDNYHAYKTRQLKHELAKLDR